MLIYFRYKPMLCIALIAIFTLSSASSASEKTNIVVTIKPLHALVAGVVGATGETKLLLTENDASPHDVQMKPSHIRTLQKADIIFYIDKEFEVFLQDVFKILPHKTLKYALIKTAKLSLLPLRKGGVWEMHEKNEQNSETGHHHEHGNSNVDMHVWLDPKNAHKLVIAITKALSTFQPENRNLYKQNAKDLIQKIEQLDAELHNTLVTFKEQPFIVFHDAYQYFEKAYDLKGVGSITLDPNEHPAPSRLQAIRNKLHEKQVQCVFREPQFSDRLVKTILEGSNTRIGILDPLGATLPAGEQMYFQLLHNLAYNFKQCLQK